MGFLKEEDSIPSFSVGCSSFVYCLFICSVVLFCDVVTCSSAENSHMLIRCEVLFDLLGNMCYKPY